MSDFLTRLAERTLGRARTVEPLLPSLWDATALTDDLATDEPGLTAPLASVEPSQPASPAPPLPMDAPAPLAPKAGTPVVAPETLAPPTVRPTPRGERAIERESTERPAARLDAPDLVPARPETTVIRERVEHTERVEVRAGTVSPRPSHDLVAATVHPARAESVPPLLPPVPPLVPRTAEHGEVLRPVATAHPAPAPAQPRVEITIGRIDVRATSKPAPQREPRRRATAARPRLSLQDYLAAGTAEQNGGRP